MSEEEGARMGETEVTMASLGKPGEPCEQCGAPLAADQRYCLECGARRGGPRVDYRGYMAAPAAPEAPAGQAPQPAAEPEGKGPSKGERDFAPLAAVGGIAVLGLMLLVGVLIGKGDGGGGSSETPVVIERGAAGEGEGGGEANTSDSGSGSSNGGLTGGSASASGKKNEKGGKEESAADAGAVEASTQELEELENESGEDAAKNALKLPDKIATPGGPPPIDKSKPPGGGEGGVTIK